MEVVFMCAANSSGAAVIRASPLAHVTPNVVMNALLLEAAHRAKVRKFVWLGSTVAYPASGGRPVREEDMMTGDPAEPYFGVGWMKRYTEMLCRFYSEKLDPPLATVVVRPSNLYGPGEDFDLATSHVTPALIRKVVERRDPVEVWGTGDDVRDLLYIDDFLDGLLLAAEKIDRYDPLNIATGTGHSVREALRMILEIDGYTDARVVFDASKPSTIPIRLVSAEKAERVLGYRARTKLREGLEKTIRWYRAHRAMTKA
jgi:GDP-L-fucose synthase